MADLSAYINSEKKYYELMVWIEENTGLQWKDGTKPSGHHINVFPFVLRIENGCLASQSIDAVIERYDKCTIEHFKKCVRFI